MSRADVAAGNDATLHVAIERVVGRQDANAMGLRRIAQVMGRGAYLDPEGFRLDNAHGARLSLRLLVADDQFPETYAAACNRKPGLTSRAFHDTAHTAFVETPNVQTLCTDQYIVYELLRMSPGEQYMAMFNVGIDFTILVSLIAAIYVGVTTNPYAFGFWVPALGVLLAYRLKQTKRRWKL